MSAVALPREAALSRPRVDQRRGRLGMRLFIATEATLFLLMFFAYFYLRHDAARWAVPPPKLTLALTMLVVLLSSSAVLRWGERRVARGDDWRARVSLWLTALLGVAFLIIQTFEYAARLREVRPTTNAYGSMFYLITGVHGLHVALGVLMLLYVSILPRVADRHRPPHRPLETAAEYWHFVDVVWVLIVAILYIGPQFGS